jgi:phosphoribosylformylglycinamidine synthase
MANRIEVALRDGVRDARGERIKREIGHFLHLDVTEVRTLDVYTVDTDLTADELKQAAAGPFSDPVIQTWSIDKPLALSRLSATLSQKERVNVTPLPLGESLGEGKFDFAVEVGFRPGVTDNVGRTAREAVAYLTGRPFAAGDGVYYSVQYLIKGNVSVADVEKIATGLLCNTLIQRPRSAAKRRPRCVRSIWKSRMKN